MIKLDKTYTLIKFSINLTCNSFKFRDRFYVSNAMHR